MRRLGFRAVSLGNRVCIFSGRNRRGHSDRNRHQRQEQQRCNLERERRWHAIGSNDLLGYLYGAGSNQLGADDYGHSDLGGRHLQDRKREHHRCGNAVGYLDEYKSYGRGGKCILNHVIRQRRNCSLRVGPWQRHHTTVVPDAEIDRCSDHGLRNRAYSRMRGKLQQHYFQGHRFRNTDGTFGDFVGADNYHCRAVDRVPVFCGKRNCGYGLQRQRCGHRSPGCDYL